MNYKLLFFLSIIAMFSCSKARCPTPVVPVQNIITTHVVDTTKITNTTKVVDTVKTMTSFTVVLQPGNEGTNTVINSFKPSNNYYTVPFLAIEAWTQSGSDRIQRSLIDFNYSSIPSGATITSAILTLYADTSFDYSAGSVPLGHSTLSGSNAWYISAITSAWSKSTVTWNTMPTIDINTRLTEPASTAPSESYSIDVTTFVSREIANPTAYYGFMFSLVTESPYRAVYFYSCNSTSSLRPKLVVQYLK